MSILIALSLAGPAAAPHVADIPKSPQFRDWIAACNNVRECEAIAAIEYSDDLDWAISVKRGANAPAAPKVSLTPSFGVNEQAGRIRVDGKMTRFAVNEEGYLESDPSDFLKAIARAKTAHVIGSDGAIIGKLPVMGATASLRWIDDQQKRVGTVTAILAGGPKPASAVPPPPAPPTIAQPDPSDAPPKTLTDEAIAAVKEAGECYRVPGEPQFYRLDKNHTVGIVPCSLGAYQGFSMVVIINEVGKWSLAPIEQPRKLSEDYGTVKPWYFSGVTSADFAPQTRMLYEFARGRGLADCGQAAAWTWNGEIFRLASLNEMTECRGTPPGDWPSVWVTQNALAQATTQAP